MYGNKADKCKNWYKNKNYKNMFYKNQQKITITQVFFKSYSLGKSNKLMK